MYTFLGVLIFALGGGGLLLEEYIGINRKIRLLLEMQQCLLGLEQAVLELHLPMDASLQRELKNQKGMLAEYLGDVRNNVLCRVSDSPGQVFWQCVPKAMRRQLKEEELGLWVQAASVLFEGELPGENKGFLVYYGMFSDMVKREQNTKKERQKVTLCTTAMGLATLLLLLL